MTESNLKDLTAKLKYSMGNLLKELESQIEEAQRLHSRARDAEEPDNELETRIYLHAVEDLLAAVDDAQSHMKYLLGDIDADGYLTLNDRGRFELPGIDGYANREFTCSNSIELWDERNRRWLYGNVEYADQYPHGYYFKQARLGLQPGMRARHRYFSSWDD
jgi:NOL1/NOP2/fmu family ribosome biogenesis protein